MPSQPYSALRSNPPTAAHLFKHVTRWCWWHTPSDLQLCDLHKISCGFFQLHNKINFKMFEGTIKGNKKYVYDVVVA